MAKNALSSNMAEAIILLRFRTLTPHPRGPTYCTYPAITHITGVSTATIKCICYDACRQGQIIQQKIPDNSTKFTHEEIGYLLSHHTLEQQKHLSLKARSILFHRRFPNKKYHLVALAPYTRKIRSNSRHFHELIGWV